MNTAQVAEAHRHPTPTHLGELAMSDRPTHIVRARALVEGATVVFPCPGPYSCNVPVEEHKPSDGKFDHLLTLLDVETHGDRVTAITVTETGEQFGYEVAEWAMVRVFADSMPLNGQE